MGTTIPAPHDWKEWRRLRAWSLKRRGWAQHEIADALDVSAAAVSQWMHKAQEIGVDALRSHPSPGHPPKLTLTQKRLIPDFLWHGAEAYGFRGDVWTCVRIAHVIEWECGVCYHKDHVSRLLKELGWTPQVPITDGAQPQINASFTLIDDDVLIDGQEVPKPNTGTLATAMAEAYVKVVSFGQNERIAGVQLVQDDVPFVQNVRDREHLDAIITASWNSKMFNQSNYWTTYLLGAFQGQRDEDADPDTETAVEGWTGSVGGSLIFTEVNQDRARRNGRDPTIEEQDTVVHEMGHAVGDFSDHPVTDFPAMPSKYVPLYIAKIRSTNKPRG